MKIIPIAALLVASATAQNLQPTGAWNSPIRVTPQNSNSAVAATSLTGNTELITSGSTSYTWTLAQAGTSGFEDAKWFVANATGTGTITLSTTTSTFSGCGSSGSNFILSAGQSARFTSNGGNWVIDGCGGAGGGGIGGCTGSGGAPVCSGFYPSYIHNNTATGGSNGGTEIWQKNGSDIWHMGPDVSGSGAQNFFLVDSLTGLTRWLVDPTGTFNVGSPSAASSPPAGSINFAGNLYQNGTLFSGGVGYCPAGICVSTGSSWGTSLVAPTGSIVGTTDTQALINKTVNGVTPTVFSYIDPTSSIQTQLNSKGTGTVTVVGAGSLGSTRIATGGGSQTMQTPSANATVDASGNLQAFTVQTTDVTHNGGINMLGVTSGAIAFSVANIAGTAVTYIWPTSGTTGYVLTDNGSITCPTDLPAGYPSTCHQLTWVAAASGISPCFIVSSGISCPGPIQSTGTGAGVDALAPGTQSLSGLPTNAVGFISPASVTGQHILQLPAVAATGAQIPIVGAESAGIAPITYAATTGTGSVVMSSAPTVANLTVTGSCSGCGSSPPAVNSMVWPQMSSSSFLTMTANRVYCRQMVAPVGETLNRAVGLMATTSTGHVSFGMYQNSTLMSGGQGSITNAPGTNTPFASTFSALSIPSSTGSISYSVCVTSDGAADTIFADAGTATTYGGMNVGLSSPNLVYYTCANSSTSGAMPSTCGTQTAIATGIELFTVNLY